MPLQYVKIKKPFFVVVVYSKLISGCVRPQITIIYESCT